MKKDGNSGIRHWYSKDGYEMLGSLEDVPVAVHQLLAVAIGYDPKVVWSNSEFVTHHINDIPWLNTPDNITVVSKAEHNRIHKPREQIDKSMCKEIRARSNKDTLETLSNDFGVCQSAIFKHIHGKCSHFDTAAKEKMEYHRGGPWTDKDTFREYYKEKDYTQSELADLWDCSAGTISNWKIKHGL